MGMRRSRWRSTRDGWLLKVIVKCKNETVTMLLQWHLMRAHAGRPAAAPGSWQRCCVARRAAQGAPCCRYLRQVTATHASA